MSNPDIHSLPFAATYCDMTYIHLDDTRSEIVLHEHREPQKYVAHNPQHKQVIAYRIDGGILSGNDVLKCDFGLLTEDDVLYLVELKGADYSHALEQLLATVRQLEPRVKVLNARVVLSRKRVPDMKLPSEQRLKKLLARFQGDLSSANKVLEETV
jgi:hypothetical protein